MAHYVAKTLGIRPNEILDSWGCAELLVAYGQYANEESYRAAMEWDAIHKKDKGKQRRPKEYAVRFITGDING